MNRSPFVAILPGGVSMAFAVDTPLSEVIEIIEVVAAHGGADVLIVRDEGNRVPLVTVHPDGNVTETK